METSYILSAFWIYYEYQVLKSDTYRSQPSPGTSTLTSFSATTHHFFSSVCLLWGAVCCNQEIHRRFRRNSFVGWLFTLCSPPTFLLYVTCTANSLYPGELHLAEAAKPNEGAISLQDFFVNDGQHARLHHMQKSTKATMWPRIKQTRKGDKTQQKAMSAREDSIRARQRLPRDLRFSHMDLSVNPTAKEPIHLQQPPIRGIKRVLVGLLLPLVSGNIALGITLHMWGSLELMRSFLQKGLTEVQQLQLNALVYGLKKGKAKALARAPQKKNNGLQETLRAS